MSDERERSRTPAYEGEPFDLRREDTPVDSPGGTERRSRRRASSVSQLARVDLVKAAEQTDPSAYQRALDAVLANLRSEIEAQTREKLTRLHKAELADRDAQLRALREENIRLRVRLAEVAGR